MHDALLLTAAQLSGLAGMGWLALAMETHWEQVHDTPLSRAGVVRLRILGTVMLTLALGLCLVVDHASMAALVWVMVLTASALTVAFTLTWRPHWLRGLAFLAK